MMTKTIISIMMLMAMMLPQHLSAQKQARDVFNSMPDSVLPYLTAVNRADCIDYLDSKMKARVTNRFDQKTEMTDLSGDYIKLQLSPESTWQMKLLPLADSTQVVCVVRTVCASACDSSISFYTTDWRQLPATDYLQPLPEVKDFFTAEALADEELAPSIAAFDMRLLKLDFTADDTALIVTLTTAEYVPAEALKKVESSLNRTMKYDWLDGMLRR